MAKNGLVNDKLSPYLSEPFKRELSPFISIGWCGFMVNKFIH